MIRPNPKRFVLGSTDAIKVYLGSQLVWPEDTCITPMGFMNSFIPIEPDPTTQPSNNTNETDSFANPLGF